MSELLICVISDLVNYPVLQLDDGWFILFKKIKDVFIITQKHATEVWLSTKCSRVCIYIYSFICSGIYRYIPTQAVMLQFMTANCTQRERQFDRCTKLTCRLLFDSSVNKMYSSKQIGSALKTE